MSLPIDSAPLRPWRGVYGRDGALSMVREIVESWEWVRVEPARADRGRGARRGALDDAGVGRDGIEVRLDSPGFGTIRDGLIVRICLYQEREEALEAAGLSE